jgi:hypothetical protein
MDLLGIQANKRAKSDEDGGKGGAVEVVGIGSAARDNSAASASSGPSGTSTHGAALS